MSGPVDLAGIHVPATGNFPPASWATQIRDNFEAIYRNYPHCGIYRSTNQTGIVSATRTPITFDSERLDVQAMHSTVTNTSRVTIPAGWDGFYGLIVNLNYAALNTTGVRNAELRLNGTTLIGIMSVPAVNADQPIAIPRQYQFVAGDYVEATATHTAGANATVTATGNYSPELTAVWLGY